SISASVVPVEYNKMKINFVDTPGYFDFIGEVNSALRACEAAVILVDAFAGVQVGTEKAWNSCKEYDLPTFFLINKIDKENVDVDKVVADLKQEFGTSVVLLTEPIEGDVKEALTEAIAESDEELLEKYFEGEEFTDEEFRKGLMDGIATRSIIPVLTCCSLDGTGVEEFLAAIQKYAPAPGHKEYQGVDANGETIIRKCDVDAPVSAFIFKTLADPFVGKISLIKVISGKITQGLELYNTRTEKNEKMGTLFYLRGKNQSEVSTIEAGDIVAATKLQYTQTGDTLCDKNNFIQYPPVMFPEPSLYMAIEAKAKGDEEKISSGIARLLEEDPSFTMVRNAEIHQTLIGGQGDIQIGIITAKLKDKYGVDVELIDQKIAYRETIKGNSDVQGKHKKQSGGAGQYGDVHIRFSSSKETFEFTEELFGGSVPKNYVPAVEKGLRESMEKGPLAGYPVVNIKAVLYDGSYHDVDSNEMAFKIAASLAFKKGIEAAKPILLEPVMHVEVTVPDEYMGDVMGDMNKRRGKILGMEPLHGGGQKVIAEVPEAEMFKYAIILRSMTQARGSFTMKFVRYEEVPAQLAEKIIEEANSEE
ncbi:MAG TPA: elongation factor G, partial [Anaerovoracaceae bacterium]|nr:elongation factor G [Anaerovoracaceae bacterium]